MCDQHTDTREVGLSKAPPQALIKSTDTIVRIRRTFSIWNAVEEVTIIRSFLPHAFHLSAAWLEIAKVLFSQPGLFVDLDGMSIERRRGAGFGWRGEGAQDAFGGFAGAAVWRCEDLQGVVWFQEGAKAVAGVFCLGVVS